MLTDQDIAAEPIGSDRPIRLDLATTFRDMPQVGQVGRRLAEQISAVSQGRIDIQFHAHNAFGPALRNFDVVSSGALDAAFSSPAYWAAKDPAFPLLAGGPPFGARADEYLAWLYAGGGLALHEALYAPFDIVSIPAAVLTEEGGGWFNRPIDAAADFDGLRLRFFGLGALALERLGADVHGAGGRFGSPIDACRGLRDGDLDGAKFLTPAIDIVFGFQDAARFLYLPSWHQSVSVFDLIIHRGAWEALSAGEKRLIQTCCGDSVRRSLAESEALQAPAIETILQAGVQIRRYPNAVLQTLRQAWDAVADAQAAASPSFAHVLRSYTAFRRSYARWNDIGAL